MFLVTAQGNARPVGHDELASFSPYVIPDEPQVHDMAFVRPEKQVIAFENLLKNREVFAHQVPGIVLHENIGITTAGLEVHDVPDFYEMQAFLCGKRQGVRNLVRREPAHLLDLFRRGHDFVVDELVKGFAQFVLVHGLHEVIEGVETQGLDGILVVSGCKHYLEIDFIELLEHLETAQERHFDVEENQVGPVFVDEVLGLCTFLGRIQDRYIREFFEHVL